MVTHFLLKFLRDTFRLINPPHPLYPPSPPPHFTNPLTMEKVSLESMGYSEADLNQISDTFTCQDPISSAQKPRIQPKRMPFRPSSSEYHPSSSHHETPTDTDPTLEQLQTTWSEQEDPLHQSIIDGIKILCESSADDRKDLLQRYKHLVKISGEDLPQLIHALTEPHVNSYSALLSSIKMGIVAYSSAISRNAKAAIADIAVAAADLQTTAVNVLEQYHTFQETLDHVALSWNNTSKSMSLYMEEMDKKTLKTAQPGPSSRNTTNTPSVNSAHSPDLRIGVPLKLLPGKKYTSEWGSLSIDVDGNVGFCATTSSGAHIARLVDTLQKPRVLEMVLDRDLNKIIYYLQANSGE